MLQIIKNSDNHQKIQMSEISDEAEKEDYSPTMCPVLVQGRHRRRSEIGVFVSFMPHQTPEMQSGHLKPGISNICALEHG